MSLSIPNLDDRNFEDLMKEALSLIPVYDKGWTNYNPSDPGITLLELFSWLSELTIYRINRVPDKNYRKFLELLSIKYLFRWNEIPGNDSDLIEFLAETYKVDWIKIAKIEKVNEGKAINIHFENNSIFLNLSDNEDKVTIQFGNGDSQDLDVKKELKIYENVKLGTTDGWMFRWEKVPGADKEKLINSLILKDSKYSWLNNAYLEKTNMGKSLKFSYEIQSDKIQNLILCLNNEENKVELYEGICLETSEKKYEFNVKKDLSVYGTVESDIKRGLESITKRYRAITSDDYEFLANECIETLQAGLAGRSICINNRNLEYGLTSILKSQLGHVSVIIIPDKENPGFLWDEIPGKDNLKFLKFLQNVYAADWLKTAKIEKSKDSSTITVSEFNDTETATDNVNSILLKMIQKVNIKCSLSIQYSSVQPEFDWKEIPGKDEIRLLEFLGMVYEADWIKKAKIKKSEDENTIIIYREAENAIVSNAFISININRKNGTYETQFGASINLDSRLDWDEIPGKNNDLFLEFIAKAYGADWIKSGKIVKSPEGSSLTIFDFSNSVRTSDSIKFISVSSERKKVILESQSHTSYELIPDREQGKINVYCYTVDGNPSDLLKDLVKKYLDKRKLVTTKLHIVAPNYLEATLSACISLKADTLEDNVITEAKESINKYFNSLQGGKDCKGWPIGRNLYKSEIYQLLESVKGVDHVVSIRIGNLDAEIDNSDADFIELEEYQLIKLTKVKIEVCNE